MIEYRCDNCGIVMEEGSIVHQFVIFYHKMQPEEVLCGHCFDENWRDASDED